MAHLGFPCVAYKVATEGRLGTVAPNYSRFRSQVELHDVQRRQQHQRGGVGLSMELPNVICMEAFEERCRTGVAEYEASD